MSLANGVYALELVCEVDGRELTVNPAAVETPRGLVLVDAGVPEMIDVLADALVAEGLDIADTRAVIVTHHDGDHAGAVDAVLDRADDPIVYAHEAATPFVDGRCHPEKTDPEAERYPPTEVDVCIQDGVSFRTHAGRMRAVFTPGHAPGHVSLYFPDERLLLAADALRGDADGVLTGPSERFTPDMEEACRSIGRLAELDIERVHCHHGGTVDAGTDAVRELHDSLSAEHLS